MCPRTSLFVSYRAPPSTVSYGDLFDTMYVLSYGALSGTMFVSCVLLECLCLTGLSPALCVLWNSLRHYVCLCPMELSPALFLIVV
jgi:hypothetical protein